MTTDQERATEIQKQVERWDLFAKLCPTIFLLILVVLIYFNVVSVETAFYIGLGLFSVTAVVWWYWTIYNIRYLVGLLSRASKKLLDVSSELSSVKKELLDIENDKK
jgi:hypothetical protein